ncbi:dihydroorotase [Planctomycetales bacterium]|nr:dihydroorotase [Planctomycetales bacterium]
MSQLLITGGRVIDPAQKLFDVPVDILLGDGKILALDDRTPARAAQMQAALAAAATVEKFSAAGQTLTPGLIDMHVHFREPGAESEETIASGAAAAIAGGFTTVACMPNTEPAIDSEADINFIYREAHAAQMAEVLAVGAITAGRASERLAEMANMARGGAVAFSDDGRAVGPAALLRQALLYAKMLGKPLLEHCEEPSLAAGGVMNEGEVATELGLPGIPAEAEEIIVARDLLLVKLTGARLHLQHISTRGAVAMLRAAKNAGLPVTAEVTPHHLTLTDANLRTFNPVYKVNPPLRSAADVAACVAALADGTIDAIASDHAPHLQEEKEVEMAQAPFGLLGLETAFGVVYTHLVATGKIPLARVIEAMTTAPAKILGCERGTLAVGAKANLTIWDLTREWTVNPAEFKSKSKNCPWNGQKLCGKPAAVFVGGERKL